MPSIFRQRLPEVDNPELFLFLKVFQGMFVEDKWTPQTTGITHFSGVSGWYQRLGRIVFCGAVFQSDGALAVAVDATVQLPVPPYFRGGIHPFAAHEFKFSDHLTPGGVQQCWMNTTSGLVLPQAAIPATVSDIVFSGWYYTE